MKFRPLHGLALLAFLLAFGGVAAAQPIPFKGLTHTPVGAAQLTPGGGGLVVGNIGSSGQDGVAIDLGDTPEGWVGAMQIQPASSPPGSQLTAEGFLPLIPDPIRIVLARTATGYDLSVDFSGLASPEYTIQILDTKTGAQLHEEGGLSGPALSIVTPVPAPAQAPLAIEFDMTGAAVRVHCGPALAASLDLGGASYAGDLIVYSPEVATSALDDILQSILVTGMDSPAFTLIDEALFLFDGVPVRALGQAAFNATGGHLVVSNIGSSGQDGVRSDFPPVELVALDLLPVNPGDFAPGGQLLVESGGSFGGSQQLLGVLGIERDPNPGPATLVVTPDFSPIGASTHRVQVVDGGGVVVDVPAHTGVAALTEAPLLGCGKLGTGPPCFFLRAPAGSQFLVDGLPYAGDELRVLAESGGSIDFLSSMTLRAAGLGQLTVTDETIERLPTLFDGLLQRPFGHAHLEPGGSKLIVSNIGSSGQDGVWIDLGAPDGFGLRFAMPPDVTGLKFQPRGRFGEPGPLFGFEAVPAGIQMTPDFSPVGSPTYTARILADGTLVHEAVGLSGPAVAGVLPAAPPAEVQVSLAFDAQDGSMVASCISPLCGGFFIGGTMYPGDRVEFRPEAGYLMIEMEKVRVSSLLADFSMSDESLQLFGNGHLTTDPGLVRLDAGGGTLTVSNIGSSGQDGVSIDPGEVEALEVEWQPLPPPASSDPDAVIRALAVGTRDGVPDQPLGTLEVHRVIGALGPSVQFVPDFSNVGSPTHRVQVFDAGAQVLDVPGHNGPAGDATTWPIVLGKLGGATECYVARHPPGTDFMIGSTLVTGDEIRVLAETASVIGTKTGFTLEVDPTTALTITDERSTPPTTTLFDGLVHAALGEAQLEVSSGREHLIVSNIGSSGEDGVDIDLGGVQFYEGMIRVDTTTPDLHFQSTGILGGNPDQPAGALHFFKDPNGYQIVPDFSPVGATTYTARVLVGGNLLVEESGLSGAAVSMVAPQAPDVAVPFTYDGRNGTMVVRCISPLCGGFVLGGNMVPGDAVELEPEAAIYLSLELQKVQVTSYQGGFILDDEGIGAFGLSHHALGKAALDPGGHLIVSNIGSSGQDGVSIDLGVVESFDLEWFQLPVPQMMPAGARLSLEVFGRLDGIPDQSLGTYDITNLGTTLEHLADFSNIGSPTQHVQVLDGGALVADLPGHTGPAAVSSAWPIKVGKLGGGTECYRGIFPPGTDFDVTGGVVTGDELRILAESGPVVPEGAPTIDYKSGFVLKLADIPSIEIVAETAVVPPLDVPGGPGLIPTRFGLHALWPNPSRGTTALRFGVPVHGRVTLSLYDVGGRRVRDLTSARYAPGFHVLSWDGRLDHDRRAAPGVYFVRGRFEGDRGRRETLRGRVVVLE